VPLVLMLRVLPCGDDDDDDDEAGSMRETKRKHNASKQLHHAHIASTRECSCSSVEAVAWLGTVHGNERGVGRFEEAVAVVVRSHSPPPFREAPPPSGGSQLSSALPFLVSYVTRILCSVRGIDVDEDKQLSHANPRPRTIVPCSPASVCVCGVRRRA